MIRRIANRSVAVQVMLLLAAAPLVVWLIGLWLTPLVVALALEDQSAQAARLAADAARIATGIVAACALVTAAAAAIVLRASIGTIVGEIQCATASIADGDFRHRIRTRRRDQLGELAASIDVMAERLERLEQARRRTLACISHELRTPLTVIRGQAFTLRREAQEASRIERFDLIDAEVVRLDGLIEELVDVASMHAGAVRLERSDADLSRIVEELVDRFVPAAQHRGLRFDVRSDHAARASVSVDVPRLHQVLANLLANAVRHADRGSSIDVAIGVDRKERHHLVRIGNQADPIRSEDRRRIFEPFEQAGAAVGRVGLGLPIARSIVEAHGGSLVLESAQDERRVEFVVALPRIDSARWRVRGAT